jgi:hypothetical protein
MRFIGTASSRVRMNASRSSPYCLAGSSTAMGVRMRPGMMASQEPMRTKELRFRLCPLAALQ